MAAGDVLPGGPIFFEGVFFMAKTSADKSVPSAAWQRLKKYNPHIVDLDDRAGPKKSILHFFDGESGYISEPIFEFDGYPAEHDYFYFIPAILLVVASFLLPLAPFVTSGDWRCYALAAVVYAATCGILCVGVAFHLFGLRTEYIRANGTILATNFVTRARGVRSIIHMFKRMLRWRRFMRYAMNFGYVFLGLTLGGVIYVSKYNPSLLVLHHDGIASITIFVPLFVLSIVALRLLEFGRIWYTRGVDPTLALVLMIEEISGTLLGKQQLTVITPDSA